MLGDAEEIYGSPLFFLKLGVIGLKAFTTYEKQIEILKERKLYILDEQIFMAQLEEIGYYNLINGYGDIFQYVKDYYCRTATDQDILNLYRFDKNLRNLVYKYALQVESKLKAKTCHIFSKYHGIDHRKYLNPKCFDQDSVKQERIKKLIIKCFLIIKNGSQKKSNKGRKYIIHYLHQHGFVPLWVLARAMTLGEMSVFYSNMKPNEKLEISTYFNIKPTHLEIMLKMLGAYRNIVAHDERIYCAKLYNDQLPNNLPVYAVMKTPKNKAGISATGRKDFLALMVIFKYLLSPIDFASFMSEFEAKLISLEKKIKQHFVDKIKESMGLLGDWIEIKKYRVGG